MKVAYCFRSYRKGVFSIEVLFRRIIASLNGQVKVHSYYIRPATVFKVWMHALFHSSEVYHIAGDVNFTALGLNGRKTILTIHDIGHYALTLKGWRKLMYKKVWFDWPLRKVAFITTVSAFSKQQLIDVFGIESSRIKVIHNPFPATYRRAEKKVLSERIKILQIGGGEHKNLNRLIAAVEGLSCELVLVRPYDKYLDDSLKQKGIACSWYFNLSEEEVYELYRESDLVFFASTYEGFGVPILEAQAIGRAVITSTCASMPEVAGEGAVLVDPNSAEEIKKAILRLIEDSVYRNGCIEKGYKNLERFHPDLIAQQYMSLYTKIATEQ